MTDRVNAPLQPTAWHTIGPFFPRTFFRAGDNDLRRRSAEEPPTGRGEALLLRGRVLQEGGAPCVNAVLEAWQADAGGRFRHPLDPSWREADPDFLGWGRAWTDDEGCYEFYTVMPGAYQDAAGTRAPHINLAVLGSGIMRRLATTVFFPDKDANAADPVLGALPDLGLRARLVAAPDGEVGNRVRAFRFDIRLRGEQETPFFED